MAGLVSWLTWLGYFQWFCNNQWHSTFLFPNYFIFAKMRCDWAKLNFLQDIYFFMLHRKCSFLQLYNEGATCVVVLFNVDFHWVDWAFFRGNCWGILKIKWCQNLVKIYRKNRSFLLLVITFFYIIYVRGSYLRTSSID